MKIAVNWPKPEAFITNEIRTLGEIAKSSKAYEAQGQLASSANEKYRYYQNKDFRKVGFSFSSWIDFPESQVVTKASIECLIIIGGSNAYEICTYSFGLFKLINSDALYLIKKFHIDFISTPNTTRLPLKPIFHLQSPGELSPMLKGLGIIDDHLEPGLSEPRLCSAPTTLALLTDFLLREFGGDHTSGLTKLTDEPYWRGLVRRDEEAVLRPYFQACRDFFHNRESGKSPEKDQLFSQDFVYGKN